MKKRILLAILVVVSLYLMANDQLLEQSSQSSVFSRQSGSSREITMIFEEDFENGAADWAHYDETAPSDWNEEWHLSTVGAYDGNSWWMGDEDLGGYTSHRYLVLDTPSLVLSGDPELNFMMQLNCEDTGGDPPYNAWDGANIRISTDGGVTWDVIEGTPVYNGTSFYSFGYEFNEGTGIPGWGSTELYDAWTEASFDLSSYANQEVKIRFAFASDPAYDTSDDPGMFGFRVDDIAIDTNNGLFESNGDGAAGDAQMVAGYGGSVAGDLWHVYEDAEAPSPTHAMGCFDDGTSTYLPGMSDFIVSPEFTLPEAGEITWDVSVQTMLDSGTFPDCDYIHVELRSQIPGDDWFAWTSISNPLNDPSGTNYVFTGTIDTWTPFTEGWGVEYADLSMLAGRNVQFRFGLHTNSTDEIVPGGFRIDDFYVASEYYQGPGPENLTAELVDDQVELSWDAVTEGGSGGWLQWDDGVNDDAIGLTAGGSFYVAASFDQTDLMMYTGGSFTELEVYINDMPEEMTVYVWEGSMAANELLSQTFTPTAESWNTITLDTPIEIETGSEYWVGYSVTHLEGYYCAGTDAGPGVVGKGDWIATTAGSWDSLVGFGLDYNWNIHAYVEAEGRSLPVFAGANSEERDVTGYNIWRSEVSGEAYELIGNIPQTDEPSYIDTDPVEGVWNYYVVTALYDGEEGEYSNEAGVYVLSSDIMELGYDDGSSETGCNVGIAQYMGVKFEPDFGYGECTLTHIKYYVETPGTGQYVFRVLPDEGGLPGSNYLVQFVVSGSEMIEGWNVTEIPEASLEEVTFSEGAYWVAIFEMANAAALGKDTGVSAGHSYITVGGVWQPVTDGNLMLRSYLYYPEGLGTYGDVDGNDVIDAYDASLLLMHAVGMTTPIEPFPEVIADVDGNGAVEAYDAALILQYVVGIIDVFPVEARTFDLPKAELKAEIENEELIFTANGEFYSAVIELPFVIRDLEISDSFTYAVNGNKIAFASANSVTGEVLRIPVMDYDVSQISATVNSIPKTLMLAETAPQAELKSVYPNPFNPVTNVEYTLAQAGNTEIKIYNTRGQLVETLYSGHQEAGEYKLTWEASDCSSGIYFLRTNLAGKVSENKLILLK